MSYESINLTDLFEDVRRWKIELINLNLHKNMQVDENRKLYRRIDELESHISKLHDMINLEDRITAHDVLCRLTLLENTHKDTGLIKRIEQLESQFLQGNVFSRLANIESNWKTTFNKLGEVNSKIDGYESLVNSHAVPINKCISDTEKFSIELNQLKEDIKYHWKLLSELSPKLEPNKPYRCPVCDGKGFNDPIPGTGGLGFNKCNSCEGKGIVWE